MLVVTQENLNKLQPDHQYMEKLKRTMVNHLQIEVVVIKGMNLFINVHCWKVKA